MTYACNLRCGFCYTDSPRRTLQRSPELSDSEWLAVADQLIEAGAIEAVVTGGEPLLRKDLTIEMCRRLASAGLGVTLNSNGWFIDDAVAARLAEAPGLHVHVSVDGPTPELHDASRGVPGSWRRAIGALDALIRHGVAVHGVHVVTKENLGSVEETLELLRVLGVSVIRVTPVVEVGAAARDGGWRVAMNPLMSAVQRARERAGDSVAIGLQSGEGSSELIHSAAAPAALLVRPNGGVRTDSLNPFTFGHAVEDGLATCWERVRSHWHDPTIDDWRSSIRTPKDFGRSPVVPYLDDEVAVGPATSTAELQAEDPRELAVPRPVPAGSKAAGRISDPRGHVDALALGRVYRHGEIRPTEHGGRALIRRRSDGRIWRLNRSASIVFGSLRNGSPADAVASLAEAYPEAPIARLRTDAIDVANSLTRHGIVLPRGAAAMTPTNAASTSDLPQEIPG